jgi:hypothetical protein
MLVFVTHLAVDPEFMAFAADWAGESLSRHAHGLMLHERGQELLERVDRLGGIS